MNKNYGGNKMEKYVLIKSENDRPESSTIASKYFDTFAKAFQALKESGRNDLAVSTKEI